MQRGVRGGKGSKNERKTDHGGDNRDSDGICRCDGFIWSSLASFGLLIEPLVGYTVSYRPQGFLALECMLTPNSINMLTPISNPESIAACKGEHPDSS